MADAVKVTWVPKVVTVGNIEKKLSSRRNKRRCYRWPKEIELRTSYRKHGAQMVKEVASKLQIS